jgi:hypothetical protein
MKIAKFLASISLVAGGMSACLIIFFWYRCQSKYHYFEYRFGKDACFAVESYSNGLSMIVGNGRTPFMEGNSILWNSFEYPDGKIQLSEMFYFQLGYPFGSKTDLTLTCLPYWALVAGCSISLVPLVVYRRKKAEQDAPE